MQLEAIKMEDTKSKLCIISSYNETCGNASYTKALVAAFSDHFNVSVISLNVDLLRKADPKGASAYIKILCEKLKNYDYVNIQFEAGLFGSSTALIWKRFIAITKACKRIVITMHRYDAIQTLPNLAFIGKCILSGNIKLLFSNYLKVLANNYHASLYHRIIKLCKENNIPIIVHTQRDRNLIAIKYNYHAIFDHPLCFYTQEYIESLAKTVTKKSFCQAHNLDEDKIYIGIFGFLNKYKGHKTVIKALSYLPSNYEVLIFGGQHPHTIKNSESINEYVHSLISLIRHYDFQDRVKFCGMLNDESFLKALLACDFNVLPYLEVNQGGSAIASLSLETNSNTIFSQNLAFFELAKYAPNCLQMFTIGNPIELAHTIMRYKKTDYSPYLMEYHKKYNINTSINLYKQLFQISGKTAIENSKNEIAPPLVELIDLLHNL
ncbi:glycosyltransferase [Candidatus Rhabdochlamydia oedothoracis]|nr:glycosyltransferase [Candidatus Rhabdochlamydia oedothoracis]